MDGFIYGRISEEDGDNEENVDIQLAEARDWQAEQDDPVAGEFSDHDKSAYRDGVKRAGYTALVAAIRAHPRPCRIVVTEMSRLNRRIWKSIDLFRLAETTKLREIRTTDGGGYDLSTRQGIHNAIQAAIDAEKESMRQSERRKRKHTAIAKAGRWNGGQRPYGYDVTPAVKDGRGKIIEPGRMTVNEREADVIGWVVERLLAGYSVKSIVVELNHKGITTSKGGKWYTINLKNLLTSPTIKGVRGHNGVEYPAVWPTIISEDEWDRVQLILKAESRYVGADKKGYRTYLLTGMIFCSECGAQLTGFGRTNNRVLERRYFCVPTDPSGAKRGCGKVARLADPVELLVVEAVLRRYESEGLADAFAKAGNEDDMTELLDEYRARKLRLDDLVADYASGLLNRDQLTQAKAIVENALEETRRKLARLESGRVIDGMPLGATIRETWNANGLDWRRRFLSLLVEKVIIHPGKPGVRPWPPKDSDLWKQNPHGRQWNFDPAKVEIFWRAEHHQPTTD
jgi:site-specific DNA recombinase